MIIKERKKLNFDYKGRVYLSKEERALFSGEIIITRNNDKILLLTRDEWDETVSEKLAGLKRTELCKKQRILFSNIFIQKIDRQGRIFIPLQFRRDD